MNSGPTTIPNSLSAVQPRACTYRPPRIPLRVMAVPGSAAGSAANGRPERPGAAAGADALAGSPAASAGSSPACALAGLRQDLPATLLPSRPGIAGLRRFPLADDGFHRW